MDADNPCTLEERYTRATTSSNLKCEADTRSDVDVLIAAGWSPSRLGAALMRLHTRKDRNGLERVHEQLAREASRQGAERPEAVAAAVLAWWLNRNCKACSGRKFELIPGTPSLSARSCKLCKGTGETAIPYGSAGLRLEGFLGDCKSMAVGSIKKRLRPE